MRCKVKSNHFVGDFPNMIYFRNNKISSQTPIKFETLRDKNKTVWRAQEVTASGCLAGAAAKRNHASDSVYVSPPPRFFYRRAQDQKHWRSALQAHRIRSARRSTLGKKKKRCCLSPNLPFPAASPCVATLGFGGPANLPSLAAACDLRARTSITPSAPIMAR